MDWDDNKIEVEEVKASSIHPHPKVKSKTKAEKVEDPRIVHEIQATGYKAFELMDAEDEKQIVDAKLFDETINSLVYDLKGKKVLTFTGVMEAARRYKNVDCGTSRIETIKDDKGRIITYRAYGYAINHRDKLRMELAVEQPVKAPIGARGAIVKDSFALQKAQSKAIRNCIVKIIPANHFQAMIKLYLENKDEKK